jgi:hypothetical protein
MHISKGEYMKRLIAGTLMFFSLGLLSAQSELLNLTGNLALDGEAETQWFSVEAPAGSLLSIETTSLDFVPFLEIQTPDGRYETAYGDGASASFTGFSSQGGTWRIGVGSEQARSSGNGAYFLKVLSAESSGALQPGDIREGVLSSDVFFDSTRGRFIDWMPLNLGSGQRVRLLLESSDFDAYLYVMFADGEVLNFDDGSGRDSLATIVSDRAQLVMLGASSFSGDSRGGYRLSVDELGEPVSIRLDEPVEENWGSGELFYSFTAPRTGQYLFSLSSPDFDTILKLTGPDGYEMENDDAPGGTGTDSALSLNLESGEQVLIEVSAWSTGRGAFTLAVSGAREIAIGDEIRDFLNGDAIFSFSGRRGDYVIMELLSNDFDTYLSIIDDRGMQMQSDDSDLPGYTYSSVIEYYFQDDATVDVTVSSFFGSGGEYLFRVKPAEGMEPVDYPAGYELSVGESVVSMISSDDDIYDVGPADRYMIYAEAGDQIRVSMKSAALDSYLSLLAPDGREFTDDDSFGGLNSVIDIIAPISGNYRLIASSYNGVGPYELSYESAGQARYLLDINGVISSDDPRDDVGKPYDSVDISLERGQSLRISVSSGDFDTRLYVYGPDNDLVAENDDYNGRDSQVEFEVLQSGLYQIIVVPFSESGRGEYVLQAFEW